MTGYIGGRYQYLLGKVSTDENTLSDDMRFGINIY